MTGFYSYDWGIDMNKEILENLMLLGKMPNMDLDNDSTNTEQLIEKYKSLLDTLESPITMEEGQALLTILPDKHFYDLEWVVLSLIESIELSGECRMLEYEGLINGCLNKEIKSNLQAGYDNWKDGLGSL